MTAPGWYYADGDPPQTQRYWDGARWLGEPQYPHQATAASTPMAPAPGGFHPGPVRRPAEPGTRIGGRIIDVLIMLAFLAGLVLLDIGGTPDAALIEDSDFAFTINSKSYDTRLEYVVFALFGFVWHVAWVHLKGGTPGKLVLGMRVADEASGQMPVELRQAALRASVYVLPFLALISVDLGDVAQLVSFGVGFVSLILLFVDDRHRTVMDRLAKTVVVRN